MPDDNGTTYNKTLERIQKPLFPKVQNLCHDKLQTKTECDCGGTLFHVELLYTDTGYEDRYMEMSGILYECVACGYIHTAWRDGI